MKIKILRLKRATRLALLTLLLCVAGLTNAVAQSFTVGNLNYSINDDGASVTVTGHVDGQNASGELVIPESVEQYGITYPVTVIGESAFFDCYRLTGSLVIPNSVVSIGYMSFRNCSGFTGSLTIPENVAVIDWCSFGNCGFTTLNYNATDCSVNSDWINNTSMTTLNIGENVQTIPAYFLDGHTSFSGELVIPESVTSIGNFAFNGCSGFTGSLTIPEAVSTIGNSAFNGCSGFTGSLTIPNNVTFISEDAFSGCNGLNGSLTIPNSITSIGVNAFSNCSGFSGTLTLGQSLTQIGNSAFFGSCEGFTSFDVKPETPPTLGTNVFGSADYGIPVQVPCGTLDVYNNASGWNVFTNIQEPDPCLWNITATANPAEGGTISGAGTYEQGSTCTLVATPAEGYEFVNWKENDAIVSTETTFSFTVTSNRNLVANFGLEGLCDIVFNLYDSYGDGWNGNKLIVNANDDANYSFYEELTINGGSSATYTLSILDGSHVTLSWIAGNYTEECSFNVQFASNGYPIYQGTNLYGTSYEFDLNCDDAYTPLVITTVASPEEGGSISGAGNYLMGEVCTLTATPAEGRSFVRWMENGQEVSTEATYSFTVTGSRDLVASFSALASEIIVFADPNVEAICVANWDTDGDGFLSYAEAAAVTDLGQAFQNHIEITSFAEIYYFTGLTSIAAYAFNGCSGLTGEFVIPDAITSVGQAAFRNCTGITTLTIGSGLELVNSQWDLVHYSESAFYNCTGITTLNYNAINCNGYALACYDDDWNCYNLLSVFSTCSSLATINIGENVQSIPIAAFKHTNVNTVNYNATNCNSLGGYYCTEQYAFEACEQLTTINIGENVQTIPSNAFRDCSSLTSVVFSESVTTIGDFAFYGCSGLTDTLTIPESVTTIGGFAFYGCSGLTGTLTIPESVTTIGDRAFANTGFTTVNFNATNCTYMGSYYDPVFDNCNNLTTLNIGSNVEVIPSYAFYNCSGFTGSLVIPDNVTVIGQFAFRECSGLNGTLTIGNSVTEIGNNAFYHCYGLSGELTIPNAVQTIGIGVFIDCGFTGTLTIGTGVTSIGNAAFRRLNINEVDWNAVNCTFAGDNYWDAAIFAECNALATLVFSDEVESIPEGAFCQCGALTGTLNLPSSLTSIGGAAFYGCSGLLGDLIIPNSVTYIGWEAFNGCTGLDGTLTIGHSVSEIGFYAFNNTALTTLNYNATNCNSIGGYDWDGNTSLFYNFTTVNFSDNVESLPNGAFRGCTNLTDNLILPNSLITIGDQAFYNCYGFEGIVMGNSVETIGSEAFRNCGGMRGELTLPESLVSVGTYAFAGCTDIGTVNYNATNCETMGNASQNVFAECFSLTHLHIGENVESIPNYAFKPCFLLQDMNVGAVVPPVIQVSTFGSVPRVIPVHVPYGSGEAYRNAPYWEEFFNITEDYSPSQYTCHWNANPNQFEGNMTVTGIIQINGSEQATDKWEIGAFCGDECRGSQLLAHYPQVDRYLVFLTLYGDPGDLLTFRLYDHEANVESPLGCTTHLPFATDSIVGSMNDPYVFNFGNMQVTYLAQGWTWYSTYIEQDGNNGLEQLEESLDGNGLIIKSQANGYVTYSSSLDFWYGSLSAINNESAYLINTTSSCVVTMEGETATPSAHPISLAPGWTWIGYLPSAAMDINAALAGLSATEGDMLKTQHGFASYYPGYGWIGSLRTIEPGKGLMYKSNNSETLTLVYPDSNRGGVLRANLTPENNHWKPDTHAYPDNMSVMAVVELNGEEIMADGYELAAFDANGECRGSVEMVFVEPLNRYMAFLTLSGMDAVELHFGLYDAATGREYLDSDERVVFVTNAKVGDANEPYMVRFGELTGMSESAITAQVYPNPVARGERFSIDLGGSTTQSVRVEIVDALGAVTRSMTSAQQPVSIAAPAVSGVYLLRITVEGKGTCIKKLIVR